jgi:hypothetical protein
VQFWFSSTTQKATFSSTATIKSSIHYWKKVEFFTYLKIICSANLFNHLSYSIFFLSDGWAKIKINNLNSYSINNVFETLKINYRTNPFSKMSHFRLWMQINIFWQCLIVPLEMGTFSRSPSFSLSLSLPISLSLFPLSLCLCLLDRLID